MQKRPTLNDESNLNKNKGKFSYTTTYMKNIRNIFFSFFTVLKHILLILSINQTFLNTKISLLFLYAQTLCNFLEIFVSAKYFVASFCLVKAIIPH